MKFLILLSFLIATHAQAAVLKCVNVAHSPVTLAVDLKTLVLTFGAGSDGSPMENDVKDKSVKLAFDADGSQGGWVQYSGQFLANKFFQDYRTVQIRFEKENLKNSAAFRVAMALSETTGPEGDPSVFTSYGMTCTE